MLFLSAVITVRNRAAYLEEAVKSLTLQQNAPKFEVVIVDDASTDSTPDKIRELGKRFPALIRALFLTKRLGPGGARNRGNQAAKGEAIVVQDSDDYSLPDRFAAVAAAFKADPQLDLFFSGAFRCDAKLQRTGVHHANLGQVAGLRSHQDIWHPTLAYRRRVLAKIGYPEEPADVDYGFLLAALAKGLKFGCLDRPLVCYRSHPDQISRSQNRLQHQLAAQKRAGLGGSK